MEATRMGEHQDLEVLAQVVAVLEQLGIPYAIGGSMASSGYGKVRFTQDADITVEPFEAQAERFFDLVKGDFYVSKEAMAQAIHSRTSFNLIHFESAFKIDLFVRRDTEFERQLLRRARPLSGPGGSGSRTFSFVSPEDIVLLKLRWYREGGEISDRQWQDILGVLAVQGESVDRIYLMKWAEILSLKDLLNKALAEWH
jgi:hypothetical protein